MIAKDSVRALVEYHMRKFRPVLACMLVAASGCAQSGPTAPDSASPSTLTTAPTSLVVDGKMLTLGASLWRDFQPISPPDGKPMIAALQVQTGDGSAVPTTVIADTVWLVHGTEVWSGVPREERSRRDTAPIYELIVRDGPKWEPGTLADVVVQLRGANGRVSRLRATNQLVRGTF
jgi:hypothetical protein